MRTQFKNFGRNVVLPFLDQVVGDKKEEAEEGSTVTVKAPLPTIEVGVDGDISEVSSTRGQQSTRMSGTTRDRGRGNYHSRGP
jgi:hypothetical protein